MESIILPPDEGPIPNKPIVFERFEEQEIDWNQFRIRAPKRPISYWDMLMSENRNCGAVYGLYVGEDYYSLRGKEFLLALHFIEPVVKKNFTLDQKALEGIYSVMRRYVEQMTITSSVRASQNIASLVASSPNWLTKDLAKAIKKHDENIQLFIPGTAKKSAVKKDHYRFPLCVAYPLHA